MRMAGARRNRAKLYLGVTLLIMAFIFVQSALPANVSTKESDPIVDIVQEPLKLERKPAVFLVRSSAHFMEYLALGASLFLTVWDVRKSGKASFWIPWLIGAAYAITDELHQHFVPGRSCELHDMVIDACGVAAGVAVCWMIQRRRQAKE